MQAPESAAGLSRDLSTEEPPVARSLQSVIKILVSSIETDFIQAEDLRLGAFNSVSTGVAIATPFPRDSPHRLLLCTARALTDEPFLQVQREDSDELFLATVYTRCIDCDLALVDVTDPKFWRELATIQIANVPSLHSEVLVAGFQADGELSVTKGVVSRIESQTYVLSRELLPAITVDALCQQSGSSSHAVFNNNGELIGLRFQILRGADNVGLVIPPPVIHNFLQGIAKFGLDGYQGFPEAGLHTEQLTNPYLRQQLKLDPDTSGVLVTQNRYGHMCRGVLLERDVITHIGDSSVSNNGTVPFCKHGRIELAAAFAMYQCGDIIDLRIIRDGEPLMVQVVASPCACLIKAAKLGEIAYIEWAGLVFRKVTDDYLEVNGSAAYLWHLKFSGERTDNQDCAIVLSQVLPDEVNSGYESFVSKQIASINGHTIRNLDDLYSKLNRSLTKLVRFETQEGDLLVVPSPADPASVDMTKRIELKYGLRVPTTQTPAEAAKCCTIL